MQERAVLEVEGLAARILKERLDRRLLLRPIPIAQRLLVDQERGAAGYRLNRYLQLRHIMEAGAQNLVAINDALQRCAQNLFVETPLDQNSAERTIRRAAARMPQEPEMFLLR